MRLNKEVIKNMLSYFILIIFSLIILVPVLWMVSTSFKSEMETFSVPPTFIFKPTLEHYKEILIFDNFSKYFLNSTIISLMNVIIALCIGVPLAYGTTRFDFKGKNTVMNLNLITQLAPPVAFIIPYYVVIRFFHLLDTHFSLSMVYLSISLPFVIWMMRSFFEEIPASLEESAMIDGCTRLQAFYRISLPLAAPGLVATAIFAFILSWNEFFFALLLTDRVAKTAPVAIASYNSFEGIYWGKMTAAGTLVMLPVLIFALFIRKMLIRGLTAGAVKG